jgi:hypothetical protein
MATSRKNNTLGTDGAKETCLMLKDGLEGARLDLGRRRERFASVTNHNLFSLRCQKYTSPSHDRPIQPTKREQSSANSECHNYGQNRETNNSQRASQLAHPVTVVTCHGAVGDDEIDDHTCASARVNMDVTIRLVGW